VKKLSLLVLLAVACLAADKPEAKKTDKERIQGTWVVKTAEADGKELPGDVIDKLKKGKLIFKDESCTNSLMPERTYLFRLDSTKRLSHKSVQAALR
jgi:uncharacterized protein (TIGR03067 family)